ncbi:hypothetical protein Q4469_18900 [Bacteroides caccae]|uniref:Uncharacterized protein n=1 Tax=Bacteroides caccae TaxID=47678 RepID=A0AAW7WU17_9BACE|nr:hypothetical protein [Bacteroides caccae]MDO6359716.1 hypothetical protein [Bacteroides caccae]
MGQGRELGLSPPGDSYRLGCRFRSPPAPLHHFLRGRTRLCHHESKRHLPRRQFLCGVVRQPPARHGA